MTATGPEMVETKNPFTGLPGYRVGRVTVTALHNAAPANGNWVWVVGDGETNACFRNLAVAKLVAFDAATGRKALAAVAAGQEEAA